MKAEPRCLLCNKPFRNASSLTRHLREVHFYSNSNTSTNAGYACRYCGKGFMRERDERRHESEQHGNGKKPCQRCGKLSRRNVPHKDEAGVVCREVDVMSTLRKRSSPRVRRNNDIVAVRRPYNLRTNHWICTVCRTGFQLDEIEDLFNHLKSHFNGYKAAHRCVECEISFAYRPDLERHLLLAKDGDCGFKFHHSRSCSVHHPPEDDRSGMLYRLRSWEQNQLQSYIRSVDALRKRQFGDKYHETEGANACRSCYILNFYRKEFPDEYENSYNQHLEDNRSSRSSRDSQCCNDHYSSLATKRLIQALTVKSRRASSVDTSRIEFDSPREAVGGDDCASANPGHNIAEGPTIDTSYLSEPLEGILHWAACSGDFVTVQRCISSGADLAGTDLGGRAALHWAAASGSEDTVNLILANHDYTDSVDVDGQSSLFVAVQHNHTKAVQALLKHVANIHVTGSDSRTPLHAAARIGDVTVIKLLIDHGANIDAVDWCGQSPLHVATKAGRADVVEALCNLGVDKELRDRSNRTALYSAIDSKRFSVGECLVLQGANVSEDMAALAIWRRASSGLIQLLQTRVSQHSG